MGRGDKLPGCIVLKGHIIKSSVWHAKEFEFYPEGKEKSFKTSN